MRNSGGREQVAAKMDEAQAPLARNLGFMRPTGVT